MPSEGKGHTFESCRARQILIQVLRSASGTQRAFLASAVEMVEGLTIVLPVAVTRDWRTYSSAYGITTVSIQ